MHILIVDDRAFMREMISKILCKNGKLKIGIDFADRDEMIERALDICFPPILEEIILPDNNVKNKNTKYTSSVGYFDKFIRR